MFTFVVLCGLLVFAYQYTLKDCFWWECVSDRNFRILDWELPVFLFPEDANLSHISPSSEGAGEIERGSQSIHWNSGNGIARYEIKRYPTIKKAKGDSRI